MSEEKPLHVLFAEKCMGWTNVRLCCNPPEAVCVWHGQAPLMRGLILAPRVDLPGYDLGQWEAANELDVVYLRPTGDGAVRVRGYVDEFRAGWDYREHIGFDRREAILRVLIALADAGKLVKP